LSRSCMVTREEKTVVLEYQRALMALLGAGVTATL